MLSRTYPLLIGGGTDAVTIHLVKGESHEKNVNL